MNAEVTVFTPTYNRAHTLSKLYDSLCNQTDKRFEWIVIDDGSIDSTETLLLSMVNESKINIRYIRTTNGGKHRAINKGVCLASTDWFFIVDSDDFLPSDAIEFIIKQAALLKKENNYSHFAGICGLRSHYSTDKPIINTDLFKTVIDSDFISFRHKMRIKGDMAEVIRTEIFKQFPFPEFDGEKFMDEAVVWNQIADNYNIRFIPKTIYYCEYLADGLTNNVRKIHRESPKGSMLVYNQILRNKRYTAIMRLKAAINYWRYSFGIPFSERQNRLRPIWWTYLVIPLALIFRKLDYFKSQK